MIANHYVKIQVDMEEQRTQIKKLLHNQSDEHRPRRDVGALDQAEDPWGVGVGAEGTC